ncbi:MAG: formyl transferase [Acidobacteria bacterium]|nr:MAG: formyl transferase [Acidobacteriota bacterium]
MSQPHEKGPISTPPPRPRVVLICHRQERIDFEGLASWLAHTLDLVGMVVLSDPPRLLLTRARREIRRSGVLAFLDVLAFRLYYALTLARSDAAWIDGEVGRLRRLYPADLDAVPRLATSSPNTDEVRSFLESLRPDVMIARCKVLLRREIFDLPPHGTFVLHPGICPEYRNSHGCFWALSRRDLGRVGMSLLRVDRGIDTGPLYLQATCAFDEVRESHVVIQHRVVLANLDAIREALLSVWRGERPPIPTQDRSSGVWGKPRLSAYLRWKTAARRRAA